MDAGLSAWNNNRGSNQHQPSAKAQMRDNLLHNDIGNIDITKEIPINQQQQQQQQPQPQQQQNSYYPQQQIYPQQQQQQQPMLSQPQMYQPQQYNRMSTQSPAQQQVPLQQYHQQSPVQQRFQHQKPKPQPQPQHEERRAYSLNQKSISNFFKSKSNGLHFGKKKSHNTSSRVSGGGDDDDDVEIDDPSTSTLSFNDIQKIGYKNGDKFHHSEDTAPLIPTVITKEHSSMNNTEYRKYMNNQKKTTFNAMAKQQHPVTGQQIGQPRTMSLQNNFNRNAFQQQQGLPAQHNSNIGYDSNRANSLAAGTLPQNFQQQLRMPQNYPNQPIPSNQPNQQRTMSLTNNPNNRFQLQMPQNNAPQMNNSGQNNQQQYQVLQSQQGQQQFRAGSLQQGRNPYQVQNQMNTVSQSQQQPQLQHRGQMAGSNDFLKKGYNNDGNNNQQVTSPLKNQVIEPIPDNTYRQDSESVGKLNVLKLSAPQQEEERGHITEHLSNTNPYSFQRNEKSDNSDSNPYLAQQQQPLPNAVKTNVQETDISHDSKELPEKIPYMSDFSGKNENNDIDLNETPDHVDDLNLRPTSLLESSLKSLTVTDRNNARDSRATYVSSLSDSPEKDMKPLKPSGLYKLENNTDPKAYVTAPEFHSTNSSIIPDRDPARVENPIQKSEIASNSTISVVKPTSDIYSKDKSLSQISLQSHGASTINNSIVTADANTTHGKRASIIRTQDSLKKLSIASASDSSISRSENLSNMNVNISDASIHDDTFHYKQVNAIKSEPRPTIIEGEETEFNFENKEYVPYVDITEKERKNFRIPIEQLNLLNENKSLMNELTMLSMELAESIKRETLLSEKLRNNGKHMDDDEIVSSPSLSMDDFEGELRKKSAKIVELIQSLNNERMKRFIAEEQTLLKDNGAKPDSLEFVQKIRELSMIIQNKDTVIDGLRDKLSNYEKL